MTGQVYKYKDSITLSANAQSVETTSFYTTNTEFVNVMLNRSNADKLLVEGTDYTIEKVSNDIQSLVRVTAIGDPFLAGDTLTFILNKDAKTTLSFTSESVRGITPSTVQDNNEGTLETMAAVLGEAEENTANADADTLKAAETYADGQDAIQSTLDRGYFNDVLNMQLGAIREKDREQDDKINEPGTLLIPGKVDTTQKTFFHDPNRILKQRGVPLHRVISILNGDEGEAAKAIYTERQTGTFVSAANFRPLTTETLTVDGESHEALVITVPGDFNEQTFLAVEFNDTDTELAKTIYIPVQTISNGFDWVISDARPQEDAHKRELRVRLAYDSDTDLTQIKFHQEAVPGSSDTSTEIYLYIGFFLRLISKALLAEPNHFVRTVRKEGVSISDKDYYVENVAEIVQTDEFYIVNPTASELGDIDAANAGRFAIKDEDGYIDYKPPVNGDTAMVYADRQVDITDGDGNVSRENENRLVAILIYEGQWIITNSYFKNGNNNSETGAFANAEGSGNTASGNSSHAEGGNNVVSGIASHAEGAGNTVSGWNAHAEGRGNTVGGLYGHAEGQFNNARGDASHVEGTTNTASADNSHAEGFGNIVKVGEAHIQGRNALIAEGSTLFGIGNGRTAITADEINGNVDVGLVYKVDGDGNSTQTGTVKAEAFVKNDGTAIGGETDLSAYSNTEQVDAKDAANLIAAKAYTDTEILRVESGGQVDLDAYYTKTESDANDATTLQAAKDYTDENSGGGSTDLSAYSTTVQVDAKDQAILTQARAHAYSKALTDSKDTGILEDAKAFTYSRAQIDSKDTDAISAASDAADAKLARYSTTAVVDDKDATTLAAAKSYTDTNAVGKFADSVAVDNGKIVVGYSDDSTPIESTQFIPNPGNTIGNRDLVAVVRSSNNKVNLTPGTSTDTTGLINSLSDSAPNNERIKGQHIQTGSIPEDRLATSVITKLNAEDGGANKAIEALASDMEWKVEVQTYNNASAPASPATIGLGYKVFAFGQPQESHRIDFVFPTATSKADIDALVMNRKFVIEVPEGVITFEPTSHVATAVVSGGFHRERYDGDITANFTGFTYDSNGNNNYQTTLYRGLETLAEIADGSITTPKIAGAAVTETKLSADVISKLNASASAFSGHGIVLTSLGTPTLLTSSTPQAITFTLPRGKNIRDYDRILFRMTGTGIKGEYFARGLEIDSSTSTAQIVLAGLSNVAELKIYSPTTNNITITNVGGFTPNILAEIIAVDFTGEKGETPSLADYRTNAQIDAKDAVTLTSARSYADTNDATHSTADRSYADTQDNSHSTADRAYADAQDDAHSTADRAFTYSRALIDSKDASTLASAKADATTKDSAVLTSAQGYTFSQAEITSKDSAVLTAANAHSDAQRHLPSGGVTGQYLIKTGSTTYGWINAPTGSGDSGSDSGSGETYKDIFINRNYNNVGIAWTLSPLSIYDSNIINVSDTDNTPSYTTDYAGAISIAIKYADYNAMDKIEFINGAYGDDQNFFDSLQFYKGDFLTLYKSDIDDGSEIEIANNTGRFFTNNNEVSVKLEKNKNQLGEASTTTHRLIIECKVNGGGDGANTSTTVSSYNINRVRLITTASGGSSSGGLPSGTIYLAKAWSWEFNRNNRFELLADSITTITSTATTNGGIGFGESINNFSHMRIVGIGAGRTERDLFDTGIFKISTIPTSITLEVLGTGEGVTMGKSADGLTLSFEEVASDNAFLYSYELYKTAP